MAELGIVTSIIQIADTGLRLSLRLYTYGETVAGADKAATTISKDVSLTSSVLQELGSQLRKDQESPICSENAIQTAEQIVQECLQVFTELDKVLERSITKMGAGKWTSTVKEKFKWPFLQPRIELLRSNLDRLKSTLLLMLNVIIYARLRLEQSLPNPEIERQRDLVEDLARLKDEYTKTFEPLALASESSSLSHETAGVAEASDAPHSPQESNSMPDHSTLHLLHYCALINKLLEEVDCPVYRIEQEMRIRIRYEIVNTHKRETACLKDRYGPLELSAMWTGKAWEVVRDEIDPQIYTRFTPSSLGHFDMANDLESPVVQCCHQEYPQHFQIGQTHFSPVPRSVADALLEQWTTFKQTH
ncbi:MAG: hypothetical protein Q9191_007975 [Dirinaria sp. TL-2023a]